MDLLRAHDRDLERPGQALAAAACGEPTSLAAELKDVERILATRFGSSLNAHDLEDLCQDAFANMLAYAAKGNQVDNRRAFLTTVAVRAAIKLCSRRREQAADPGGGVFDREDLAADADERLQYRADLAWLAEALDSLTDLERLVYRSHYIDELDPAAAIRKLQISRATYYRRLRSASAKLGGIMTSERRIGSRERDLIERYVAGIARRSEVRRAERLIAADPLCSAVAREISELHRGAAMLLPPVLLAPAHGGILAMLAAAFSALRERIFGAADSVAGAAQGGTAAAGGGAASGGGALAAIGGAKAIAICAGGIAACGIGGLVAFDRPDRDPQPASSRALMPTPSPVGAGLASASRELAAAARTASGPARGNHHSGSPPRNGKGDGNGSAKVSDSTAAPDSAPAAATPTETAAEFDPLVSGSTPAASPDPSGSSSSGGGAAGSEFGP